MASSKKKKKKLKKTKKSSNQQTKVILVPEDEGEELDYEGGMYLEKEELKIIYNALSEYKPAEKEEQLHSILLEQFEEILVVDYGELYPDAN